MRAQSIPMPSSPIACISLLRGIKSGKSFIIWNSAMILHFAFLQLDGTRLGAQQCRLSHAHMTEIGRDTNKTSRAFSGHPVIQYKNHRGNNSTLPELGIENSQAPTLNEHTLAQAQVNSTEIG